MYVLLCSNVMLNSRCGFRSHFTAVRCPTLKAPQYGSIDVRGYIYNSMVEYYCDHGYKLYGDDSRTCLYTGQWSGSIPTCKRKYKSYII